MTRSLEQRPPFAHLSKEELRVIDRLWAEVPIAPGTVLAREGNACREFAVVVDGTARVSRDGHEIALLEAGEHFGEIGIVRGGPNPVTIVACSAMTLAVMSLREFRSAYMAMPAFRDHIDQQIDRRTVAWLDPTSSVAAPRPVPTPPLAHDGDYTLAS